MTFYREQAEEKKDKHRFIGWMKGSSRARVRGKVVQFYCDVRREANHRSVSAKHMKEFPKQGILDEQQLVRFLNLAVPLRKLNSYKD